MSWMIEHSIDGARLRLGDRGAAVQLRAGWIVEAGRSAFFVPADEWTHERRDGVDRFTRLDDNLVAVYAVGSCSITVIEQHPDGDRFRSRSIDEPADRGRRTVPASLLDDAAKVLDEYAEAVHDCLVDDRYHQPLVPFADCTHCAPARALDSWA